MEGRTLRKLGPYLFFGLLSLGILGPLLSHGYILTLDMAFGPHFTRADFWGIREDPWAVAALPFQLFFDAVAGGVPPWLIQKAILFSLFFCAGLGAYRLLPRGGPGAYLAGLFYTVNPFTYVRFLAGHWGLLWAYAFFPFALRAFQGLLERGGRREAALVALLSSLVGLIAPHGLFLLLLAYLVFFSLYLVRGPHRGGIARRVGWSGGFFLAINLYWLLPTATMKSRVVEQMGLADLSLFAPRAGSGLGVAFDMASLQGFWRGGYLYARDFFPFWWVLFALILWLAVYGFVSGYHRGGREPICFAALGMVALGLGLGAASQLTRPAFEWLFLHLPLLRGFRDSHKFLALLALAYSYLAGAGLGQLHQELKPWKKRLVPLLGVSFLLPLLYSFPIFGAWGQVRPTDYPRAWYEAEQIFREDREDFNILFLPWHTYMDYSWLPNRDKRLGNPSLQFFSRPTISADNLEMAGLYTESTNPISKYVEFLLSQGQRIDNLGELLAPLNVKYIILVHEADYKVYDYLKGQRDLKLILERPELSLFQNGHALARVYASEGIVYIRDWEELLALSRSQEILENVYLLGEGQDRPGESWQALTYSGREVDYRVEGTPFLFTVFTLPQQANSDAWDYRGEKPVKNLGLVPAFPSSPEGGHIRYWRFFAFYLPGYIVSLVTVCCLLGFLLLRPARQPLKQGR